MEFKIPGEYILTNQERDGIKELVWCKPHPEYEGIVIITKCVPL